ncbi:MAG: hypothetical protein KKH37_03130, partial [Alphaproteobacteria bacterium]|nr:hypothetical protein [Alphaproteobacteria bacterium]
RCRERFSLRGTGGTHGQAPEHRGERSMVSDRDTARSPSIRCRRRALSDIRRKHDTVFGQTAQFLPVTTARIAASARRDSNLPMI